MVLSGETIELAEWVGFSITLFCFFAAQGLALFMWYKKYQRETKLDAQRLEERQEQARKEQFEQLQSVVDKDIGSVRSEVADLRKEVAQQEEAHRRSNEQIHGHLRRVEESRPTREEMERNMSQLKELVTMTKVDIERAVTSGFHTLDRRFDEFKEYAKDLWATRK